MVSTGTQSAHASSGHFNTQDSLSILLLQVGNSVLGLPLAEVRHIAPIPHGAASRGADAMAHFVFAGEPLPYFSLWDALGLPSLYAAYEALHAMLPQRRQDHIDWMAALSDAIRRGTPFTKARSPRECAFGKWFYAFRSEDRKLSLLLSQFEHPHAVIHALADKLLALAESGDTETALRLFDEAEHSTLAQLLLLFDSADQLVLDLQRPVAVIVDDGQAEWALGADKVHDIVEVPAERIRASDRRIGGIASKASRGLLILEDESVVPLLDWQGLCGVAA